MFVLCVLYIKKAKRLSQVNQDKETSRDKVHRKTRKKLVEVLGYKPEGRDFNSQWNQ
jgi:hypothetical protein